ncbi:MAG: hypothetical protein DHS20C09_21100 [marine bacterium B5-7]|nr:MAG: hypothetical protein DHS20C09_21100 [marine bacterium B5-7]
MAAKDNKTQFKAKLLRPLDPSSDTAWAFIILPKEVSAKLPRRGRTTVLATVNGHEFQVTLEPDGQLSHWLKICHKTLKAAGISFGDTADFVMAAVKQEPEPVLPSDLFDALKENPEARAVWQDTTTIARVDWIHWIVSAKQSKTRMKRINDACDMLASGKRRVCCFDPSGFYSKALSAPKEA